MNFIDAIMMNRYEDEEIIKTRARIKSAIEFFEAHFDPDGNPINNKGRELFEKYSKVTLHNLDKRRKKAKWSKTPILIPDEYK